MLKAVPIKYCHIYRPRLSYCRLVYMLYFFSIVMLFGVYINLRDESFLALRIHGDKFRYDWKVVFYLYYSVHLGLSRCYIYIHSTKTK